MVRNDIPPGNQMVQSIHAVADFAIEHSPQFKAWQHGSNYLCCLSTTQLKLHQLIDKLIDHNINFTIFREPDLDNELTAIAVEAIPMSDHKFFFKNFKLGLR